jgi:hypothetical protein
MSALGLRTSLFASARRVNPSCLQHSPALGVTSILLQDSCSVGGCGEPVSQLDRHLPGVHCPSGTLSLHVNVDMLLTAQLLPALPSPGCDQHPFTGHFFCGGRGQPMCAVWSSMLGIHHVLVGGIAAPSCQGRVSNRL